MQDRILIKELQEKQGKQVVLAGFVDVRRDHGKLIFIDLRDESGVVQMVALPNHSEAHAIANTIRPEWVIRVEGIVNARPEKMVTEEENGNIEIEAVSIEVLSEANTPPFEVSGNDTRGIDEEVRLAHRYIDLRTARMQKNIRFRNQWLQMCRQYLLDNAFVEIETPYLTSATAEGSRDFVVPSRLQKGKFYALPQAPQQYKQLLMASGFERYFQFARAFRDEDLRADRGFEHTQIDIEMAFVDETMIRNRIEAMMVHAAETLGFVIKEKPFPVIAYKDAAEQYGDDKFDLRTEEEKSAGNVLAYAWVVDFPFFERDKKGAWTFTHNPFSAPKKEHEAWLKEGSHIEEIQAQQYDLVCNGFEVGGGSVRTHSPEVLRAIYRVLGNSDEAIEKNVGHMLRAFGHGVPPHGGIAIGVERNIMTMMNELALREVQAFPQTGNGTTAVMDAPHTLPFEQLQELGIEVDVQKEE